MGKRQNGSQASKLHDNLTEYIRSKERLLPFEGRLLITSTWPWVSVIGNSGSCAHLSSTLRRESFSQWTRTIPDSLAEWREMPGVEAKGL